MLTVPGDKSITHRALMLAALSSGTCRLSAPLAAGDTRATASCLRALGIDVSPLGRPVVTVKGRGLRPFRRPSRTLNCANSGTTARLLLGLLAAHRFPATLSGDASLRKRPMRRVTDPLTQMGAKVTTKDGCLPAQVRGGRLHALDYQSPVASAQVKTALLFAGLAGQVPISVTEPIRSRDHTERLLKVLGVGCWVLGNSVRLEPAERIEAFEGDIPGDFSSAAYLLAAALLHGREVAINNVNVNPTRTGLLRALERMGRRIELKDERESLGEPIATITTPRTKNQDPRPVVVEPAEIPSMVDEVVLLACLASRAEGTSVFKGVGELRVKESDRLALVAQNLVTLGVRSHSEGDTLWVEGTDAPPRGRVITAGDHRLAMSFAVLGTLPGAAVKLDDRSCVAVSYPDFFKDLRNVTRG